MFNHRPRRQLDQNERNPYNVDTGSGDDWGLSLERKSLQNGTKFSCRSGFRRVSIFHNILYNNYSLSIFCLLSLS